MNILEEIGNITFQMWQKGWDEYNAGNISYLLSDDEVDEFEIIESNRFINFENIPNNLRNKYIAITASGSHFRVIKDHLDDLTGVIKVADTLDCVEIVYGFNNSNYPTSELYTHLLGHSSRLKVDPNHKIIMHNHATEIVAMTIKHELDELKFTKTLWSICTECIILLPEGIGLMPWMVCGNRKIGEESALKLLEHRVVIWPQHGIFSAGTSFSDCFGLIETVNKAAKIYLITNGELNNVLSSENLMEIKKDFNLTIREGII